MMSSYAKLFELVKGTDVMLCQIYVFGSEQSIKYNLNYLLLATKDCKILKFVVLAVLKLLTAPQL